MHATPNITAASTVAIGLWFVAAASCSSAIAERYWLGEQDGVNTLSWSRRPRCIYNALK